MLVVFKDVSVQSWGWKLQVVPKRWTTTNIMPRDIPEEPRPQQLHWGGQLKSQAYLQKKANISATQVQMAQCKCQ